MKTHKKKKAKRGSSLEAGSEQEDTRQVPFGALAELTSSDVIAQVKMGMSRIEPLDHEREFGDDVDGYSMRRSGETALVIGAVAGALIPLFLLGPPGH